MAVFGGGRLGTAILARIHAEPTLVPVPLTSPEVLPSGIDAAIVTDDGDGLHPAETGAAFTATGVPWLSVRAGFGRVILGPATTATSPGCASCAVSRRRGAASDQVVLAGGWHDDGRERAQNAGAWLGGAALRSAAEVAVSELMELANGRLAARTQSALLYIGLGEHRIEHHRVLPDPLCESCTTRPDDTAGSVTFAPTPRPKVRPGSFRVRDLDEESLLRTYVDPETGVILGLHGASETTLPMVASPIGPYGAVDREYGYGRTGDFRTSRLTAITEGLERLGGGWPGARRTAVRGSYDAVRGDALDPRTLGLYPDHWYDQPGFPYQRFREDLELDWVWGYSFARQRPILVPEATAYYRLHHAGDTKPSGKGHTHGGSAGRSLMYEISNGCALGGCPEEAIMHGILEIAERDAFLMTWYARLAAPRIDLRTTSTHTQLVAERLAHRYGCTIHAFCTTLEHGIPTFWVIAEDTTGHPDRPRLLCAAGSSLDPDRGLLSALYELGPMLDYGGDEYVANRERAARMVCDPSEVMSMTDHSLCYAHPGAQSRFGFFPPQSEAQPLDSFAPLWQQAHPSDITADLSSVVDRFLATGLDVIAVDQTTSDHAAGDFTAVKVLIPGTLSMTFGHRNRRIHGLARLDRRLGQAAANPHPHPFP